MGSSGVDRTLSVYPRFNTGSDPSDIIPVLCALLSLKGDAIDSADGDDARPDVLSGLSEDLDGDDADGGPGTSGKRNAPKSSWWGKLMGAGLAKSGVSGGLC